MSQSQEAELDFDLFCSQGITRLAYEVYWRQQRTKDEECWAIKPVLSDEVENFIQQRVMTNLDRFV
jgi:hypothetical protein